ncbi:MerR family transcriptional regulator [Labedella endophytica]|uniref:MerR family transcriptional regulator n=1 Tax=Labedella endophytica TaxID=1523160 RepID=A0A3S0VUL7_9MICO|nr:MerR family transcriptional regulator [Labedella endophytica]RUR01915.1 MerR family transcriptional regulator [Labedella endophytica]
MSPTMTIGDFSRATRLSAKALRFYHREGVLLPVAVDPGNGYRLYAPSQIDDAHVIRRLRALDVPVDTIREILGASTVARRTELITAHLDLLEARLAETLASVSATRALLAEPPASMPIEHRSLPPTLALVIRESIGLADLGGWYSGARAELEAVSLDPAVRATGPRGGLWSTELFVDEHGEAALFQPVAAAADEHGRPPGRLRLETLPPVDLAVAVHRGPDDLIGHTYGALGAHVAEHELGVPGPIRETYVTEPTSGSGDVVTEIGWPIFRVAR